VGPNYALISKPRAFHWKFTKYDLFNLLQRLAARARAETKRANRIAAQE
jgi:hypothetical protein